MTLIVADKYKLVHQLGEGGMGEVWYAEHVQLGRPFAVKLMKEDQVGAGALARFQREVLAAGKLVSDHVVAGLDCGQLPDGRMFLVMEYVRGESLDAVLRREGTLEPARAIAFLRQAVAGVAVAHAAGIVHRDLKPSNLLVAKRSDGEPIVKVLDFGVAKELSTDGTALTATGQAVGTVLYMSPEQARGERGVDGRTDVYALGVILFEMLSGFVPHPGESFNQVLHHIFTQPPVRLDLVAPHLPPALVDVVHKATASSRDDRFATVLELDEALRALLPGSAPRLSMPDDVVSAREALASAATIAPETLPAASLRDTEAAPSRGALATSMLGATTSTPPPSEPAPRSTRAIGVVAAAAVALAAVLAFAFTRGERGPGAASASASPASTSTSGPPAASAPASSAAPTAPPPAAASAAAPPEVRPTLKPAREKAPDPPKKPDAPQGKRPDGWQ